MKEDWRNVSVETQTWRWVRGMMTGLGHAYKWPHTGSFCARPAPITQHFELPLNSINYHPHNMEDIVALAGPLLEQHITKRTISGEG
jgi:hypothetical protein